MIAETEKKAFDCFTVEKLTSPQGYDYWSCGLEGHHHQFEYTATLCSDRRKKGGPSFPKCLKGEDSATR